MADYIILHYSTAPVIECPNNQTHLCEAMLYQLDAPRREDAMRRRDASYVASMAREGHRLSIHIYDETYRSSGRIADTVPVTLHLCTCRRGYQLDPWSPHYECANESLFS